MKLFARYKRLNLIAIVSIFILSSIAYYFLLRFVIIGQFDESLEIEKAEIENFVTKYNRLPEVIPVKDQLTSFTPVQTNEQTSFKTIKAFDIVGGDIAEFRELFFTFKTGNKWYKATVGKSMEGTENLFQTIILITVVTILLILMVSFFINRIVLRKLWQPFYDSLYLMKDFKIGRKETFDFPETTIEEFVFMNSILKQAISKADTDYLILKEFTENASHEMQTPLAIIRSKLDLLLQDEKVSMSHGPNLQAFYNATQKLSKLNRSLLLLTKIENNQFHEFAILDLKQKIEEKLVEFEEIFFEKNVAIATTLAELTIRMNPELNDILLNNLLSNAVKYNVPGGRLNITISESKSLIISNTGRSKALDSDKLYTRFYKSDESNEHTGLGLSILKQISIVSNCTIAYSYNEGFHSFVVQW